MPEAWLHFVAVIFVQLLLCIAYAYYEKRLSDILRILVWSIPVGIVFGLLFDLVLGKHFGVNSYALGFGALFLVINGAFSYGLFAANILLLQKTRLLRFCFHVVLITAVYEVANHFFPVWVWKFALPPVELFFVHVSVGYLFGAVFVALIWRRVLGERFRFMSDLSHSGTLPG